MGFVVLVWLAFSIFVGIRAHARGRFGFGWFLLSMIFSPLLAALALLLLPAKNGSTVESAASRGDRMECLKCGELIPRNAKVCRFCGFEVLPASEGTAPEHPSVSATPNQH